MKKQPIKPICIFLTILVLSWISVNPEAYGVEPHPDLLAVKIPGTNIGTDEYNYSSITEHTDKRADAKIAAVIPDEYDSRNYDIITPVKDQGEYNNCWSHAAMACAETYAVKFLNFPQSTTDFSEMHNAYCVYSKSYDEYGMTEGDSTSIADTYINNGYDYTTIGGNSDFTVMNLSKWEGVTNDSILPQDCVNYSAPSLENAEQAYNSDVLHLTDANYVNLTDREYVKSMIMEYGCADVTIYCDNDYFSADSDAPYTNYCYIGNDQTYGNHSVVLVGWDDNYPASNFTGKSTPESNGAWIAKNSWGTTIANTNIPVGENGYFYISYEDSILNSNTSQALFYSFSKNNGTEHLYQYDGSCNTVNLLGFSSVSTIFEANIFTSREDSEILNAVSFHTVSAGEKCTVQIYKNPVSSPTDGDLIEACTTSSSLTYKGYHTLQLNAPLTLKKGDSFSVVVRHETLNDSAYVRIDKSYSAEWLSFINTSENGQSFLSSSGSNWTDISSSYIANCRIKAITHVHQYTKSITYAPDCTEEGYTAHICEIDGAYYTDSTLPALGHAYQLILNAPADSENGSAYYQCERCNETVGAKPNQSETDLIPDETASGESLAILSPEFNTYVTGGYSYALRGASLRIDNSTQDKQPLRFSASVTIPEKAEITDFGFVYTQTKYLNNACEPSDNEIFNPDDFIYKGDPLNDNIYRLSLLEESTDTNYTIHQSENGSIYTFNLVINVSAAEWEAHYAARSYITYSIYGHTFTVYDRTYSSRSVAYIAECAVANSAEHDYVRNYLNNKILSNSA